MSPAFFTLFNLAYMVLYKLQLPFFEKHKIMKTEKWPWLQDSEAWKVLLRKSLPLVYFNHLLV